MDGRRPEPGDGEEWGNLFGLPIPLRRLRWHFWSFSAGVTIMTAFSVAARLAAPPEAGSECVAVASGLQWHQVSSAMLAVIVPTVIFCGVYSPIIVEGIAMVLAAFYSRRKRQEAVEKGRTEGKEEGREEANAAWEAWNSRRLEAEAVGRPFNEPPPSHNDSRNGFGG